MTGGTGGIGRACAVELGRRGYRVLIVGRDSARAAAVLADLDGSFVRADLASMRETARAADEIAARAPRLDALLLCAGVLALAPEWTEEGMERTLALNYLSRHLLVRRLLPLLTVAPSGRVVLVANAGRYRDTLDLTDPHLRQGGRGLGVVSGRTQFANDLLAVELADRLGDTRVEVSCVYPGLVATDVFAQARGVPRPVRAAAALVQRLLGAAPSVAARGPVTLATDPAMTGGFFGPGPRRLRIPARAADPARRAALWTLAEDLVGPWLPSGPRRFPDGHDPERPAHGQGRVQGLGVQLGGKRA
ncbi:hypothetical protein Afe04nite_66480 [Asanoa ferruginea]|nr:hypothetical protein Afe04nite_66480 [Asanoa ferruginea]